MKEKIREIMWNFVAGEVTDSEAVQQVLDLFTVSGSLPSDDRIVAEAIISARKVNTEEGLLPNNNDIRMFCLGAKWMRDWVQSNDHKLSRYDKAR